MSKTQSLKHILKVLLDQGRKLELALVFELMPEAQLEALAPDQQKLALAIKGRFKRDYQAWYGNTSALIRQLTPEKHDEFASYFLLNPKRHSLEPLTEKIRGWFNGTTPISHQTDTGRFFNGAAIIGAFFSNQIAILEACKQKCDADSAAGRLGPLPAFARPAKGLQDLQKAGAV